MLANFAFANENIELYDAFHLLKLFNEDSPLYFILSSGSFMSTSK